MKTIWYTSDNLPAVGALVIVINKWGNVRQLGYWEYNDSVAIDHKWAYVSDLINETLERRQQ